MVWPAVTVAGVEAAELGGQLAQVAVGEAVSGSGRSAAPTAGHGCGVGRVAGRGSWCRCR